MCSKTSKGESGMGWGQTSYWYTQITLNTAVQSFKHVLFTPCKVQRCHSASRLYASWRVPKNIFLEILCMQITVEPFAMVKRWEWRRTQLVYAGLLSSSRPTSSSLIATQLFDGNPWSMGTRNWRQPDQWPTKSIMQIRLNIRMNTLAMFRNWKEETVHSSQSNRLSPSSFTDFQVRIGIPGCSGCGCNIKKANKMKQNF